MSTPQYPSVEESGRNLFLHRSAEETVHVRPDGTHESHWFAEGQTVHITEPRPVTAELRREIADVRARALRARAEHRERTAYPRVEDRGRNVFLHRSADETVHVLPDGTFQTHHFAMGQTVHITEPRPVHAGLLAEVTAVRARGGAALQ